MEASWKAWRLAGSTSSTAALERAARTTLTVGGALLTGVEATLCAVIARKKKE
jgi:hypothetical protein